jgi:hypothetical protein
MLCNELPYDFSFLLIMTSYMDKYSKFTTPMYLTLLDQYSEMEYPMY